MRCGVSGVDITPKPGPVLQGHRNNNPSHSVLYPLEVRAIVLEEGETKIAIVSVDAIGVTLDITERIRTKIEKKCGIAGDHVMVTCNHTHCAPATIPYLGSMEQDMDFVAQIESATVESIERANADLQPISFGLGCGSVHFNISRRPIPGQSGMALNYGGLVDRRVRVLRLDKEDGSPLAVLFHYSCHTTTKHGSEGYISPDYAGIARQFVESNLNCKALFLPGCFGNIRPAILSEGGGFASASKEELEACGHELGREVCRAARWLRSEQRSGLMARTCPLKVPYDAPAHTEDEFRDMAETSGNQDSKNPSNWAKRMLALMEKGLPGSVTTEMQVMRLGPVLLFAIPGEPVQEIGHALEKVNRGSLGAEDVWPVGYANDEIGYFCTERHHEEGGYEPNSYEVYNHPGPFKDEEKVILKTAQPLRRG